MMTSSWQALSQPCGYEATPLENTRGASECFLFEGRDGVLDAVVLSADGLQGGRGKAALEDLAEAIFMGGDLQLAAAKVPPEHLLRLGGGDVTHVDAHVDSARSYNGLVQLFRIIGGHHHDPAWSVQNAVQSVQEPRQVELVFFLERGRGGRSRSKFSGFLAVGLL